MQSDFSSNNYSYNIVKQIVIYAVKTPIKIKKQEYKNMMQKLGR